MFFALKVVVFLVLCCVKHGIADDEFKTVETSNGQVRGIRNKTLLNGIPFYSFKGIPYAKPPVGELRFKAPVPIEPWTPKVLDAFQHENVCYQLLPWMPLNSTQSEDCLTLNIYVPANVASDEKLAVLFYIHGGSFMEGSGDDLVPGPDFIVEKHTILVTINYRLGIFGFLSLNSTEYSGNMGLKDQQLALKWINANIERFGGDSKRITIFGHSAGGASVHHQALSAESRKFFRNAIAMSGTAINAWALVDNPEYLQIPNKIAEDLNQPQTTFEGMVEFLKTVSADEIFEYGTPIFGDLTIELALGPVVERSDAVQPFMVKTPEQIYQTTKVDVDIMFTITQKEKMYSASRLAPLVDSLNATFLSSLPTRGLNIAIDSKEFRSLEDEVRKFYFGDAVISEQSFEQYSNLATDFNFGYGIDKSVKLHANNSIGKVYYYWFSVDSELNVFKLTSPIEFRTPGSRHGDDLCYLFRCGVAQALYEDILKNPRDEQSKVALRTIDNMTKIYTNFAKYGEPSHEKDPIDGFRTVANNEIHFVEISNDGLKSGLSPNQKANQFWKSIEERAAKYLKTIPNQ